jgi:hypothetical protein
MAGVLAGLCIPSVRGCSCLSCAVRIDWLSAPVSVRTLPLLTGLQGPEPGPAGNWRDLSLPAESAPKKTRKTLCPAITLLLGSGVLASSIASVAYPGLAVQCGADPNSAGTQRSLDSSKCRWAVGSALRFTTGTGFRERFFLYCWYLKRELSHPRI